MPIVKNVPNFFFFTTFLSRGEVTVSVSAMSMRTEMMVALAEGEGMLTRATRGPPTVN